MTAPCVTFSYSLPENRREAWMALNAPKLYGILWDIDQECRKVIKYEEHPEVSPRRDLAEQIRSLIWHEINLDEEV